jgi:hypothetical protein
MFPVSSMKAARCASFLEEERSCFISVIQIRVPQRCSWSESLWYPTIRVIALTHDFITISQIHHFLRPDPPDLLLDGSSGRIARELWCCPLVSAVQRRILTLSTWSVKVCNVLMFFVLAYVWLMIIVAVLVYCRHRLSPPSCSPMWCFILICEISRIVPV